PGIESDVWLQTITPETSKFVSQEAKTLLTRFPETEAELFQYDVIIAFDPDWSRLSPNEQQYLNRWVSEHSGGLVCVAGEIFTPQLAMREDDFRDIRVLYPVVLN
ncbi:MAG: VWA domain-containing protein, partial [Phycisphaerae bacterium]